MSKLYLRFFTVITLLLISGSLTISGQVTAEEVMSKASNCIKTAKGVKCSFSMSANNGTLQGTVKSSGNKFAIETPSVSSWYNGSNLWTYNAASKETTLVKPTPAEIRESNPLEYVKNNTKEYTASFSKLKQAGKYVVILTPKKRSNEIKSLELVLNAKTYKPEKMNITLKSGVTSKIVIKSIDYNAHFSNTDFEYPSSKYNKVKIVDLR